MNYTYTERTQLAYADNLQLLDATSGSKIIGWENSPGCDIYLFQTAYNDALPDPNLLCGLLSNAMLTDSRGSFELLNDDIRVMRISKVKNAVDKQRSRIPEGACRYTVIAAREEAEQCTLYWPDADQTRHILDVPLEVNVELRVNMTEKKLFGKPRETGFFEMCFSVAIEEGQYQSGDMYYVAEGHEVPITEGMLQRKVIYIKASTRPEIYSRNKGVKIIT